MVQYLLQLLSHIRSTKITEAVYVYILNIAMYEQVKSGLTSSAAVAVAAAICGRLEHGAALKPINGISHILWGPQAGKVNTISTKYTLAGLALNTAACGFWAWLYQRTSRASASEAAVGAMSVAALAYVTDYHLIPRRFTPGFELSLPRRSFPWIYAALAAGLLLPHLLENQRK